MDEDEPLEDEDEWEPDDQDLDDDDFDSGLSHSQQCFYDRQDYARERYEAGEISAEQADEIRHGA